MSAKYDTEFPFVDPKTYIDIKLYIYKTQFMVIPTKEEISHLYTLKTRTQIDMYFRKILDNHLGE